jgi:hypothetical protein
MHFFRRYERYLLHQLIAGSGHHAELQVAARAKELAGPVQDERRLDHFT